MKKLKKLAFALALPASLVFILTACATKTQSGITTAATTPLSDINMVKVEIPPVLQQAKSQPYLVPDNHSCDMIRTEITQLDAALGPDLDAPGQPNAETWFDRGATLVSNSAVGALQRTAEGLVPFRSWVRKLSGAERHSKKVAASITAGLIRRGFLKGVAASTACDWTPVASQPVGEQASKDGQP